MLCQSSKLNGVALIAKTYTHTYYRTWVIPKKFFLAVIEKNPNFFQMQKNQEKIIKRKKNRHLLIQLSLFHLFPPKTDLQDF